MRAFTYITAGTLLTLVAGRTETTLISRGSCGKEFDLDEGDEWKFEYRGLPDILFGSPCHLKIEGDFPAKTCVKITDKGDLCQVTMEYHRTIHTRFPDKVVDCNSMSLYDEFCTSSSTLIIVLKDPLLSNGWDPIRFKVYVKKDRFSTIDVSEAVHTSVSVIIGVVAVCGILVVFICIITIVCCCRRRGRSGTVYRSPQMAVTTTTTQASYPAPQPVLPPQQQHYPPAQPGNQPGYSQPYQSPPGYPPAGYQPPTPQQPGYQPPPPQRGYQPPPPQPGYQAVPQSGYYPGQYPAPQQGAAGYKMASEPASEKVPIASAPPISEVYPMDTMAPPPYPGT